MKPNQDNHLKFERLLTELFATFVNVTQADIGTRLSHALERIGRMLLVDRCILGLFDKTKNIYEVKHGWSIEDIDTIMLHGITESTFPWIARKMSRLECIELENIDEIPDYATVERNIFTKIQLKSMYIFPLANNDSLLGAISFERFKKELKLGSELVLRLKIVADVFAQALMKVQADEALCEAYLRLEEMKDQIESERNYLQEEIRYEHNFENIIGQSCALCTELERLEKVAVTDTTVLILGETGTGKELFSRAVHSISKRRHRPLIKVNCASLPANLIESELFGHERGAYTGAHTSRKGRFELADGGTILLDEIGELPIETQGKLLNVLQEGEFERLGSSRIIKTDVRIIAATNRDLDKEVDAGRFRKDLFYRLNKIPIVVPPLRDRIDDIPLLVDWIVKKSGPKIGKKISHIPISTMESLKAYSWPGNIRELENVIESAIIYSVGGKLTLSNKLKQDKFKSNKPQLLISGKKKTLAEINHDHIEEILIANNWKIEGPNGAANALGLPPSTLRAKMSKYGIKRKQSVYITSGKKIKKSPVHLFDHPTDTFSDQTNDKATEQQSDRVNGQIFKYKGRQEENKTSEQVDTYTRIQLVKEMATKSGLDFNKKPENLNVYQYVILCHIYYNRPFKVHAQSGIGSLLNIPTGSVRNSLRSLDKKGYIANLRSINDGINKGSNCIVNEQKCIKLFGPTPIHKYQAVQSSA